MLFNPEVYDLFDNAADLQIDDDTGLKRLTISSRVKGGQRQNKGKRGGMGELGGVRELVDEVVGEFLDVLAGVVPKSLGGVTYKNGVVEGVDALKKGEGIEHYHYYTKGSEMSDNPNIMDLHVDAGCFIAMTVGGSSSSPSSPDPFTLSIKTPSTSVVPLSAPPSSLIILIGSGMSSFLSPAPPFPPLPHSLSLPLSSFSSFTDRGWYGRMYFPPASSLLPAPLPHSLRGEREEEQVDMEFSEMFERMGKDKETMSNGIRGVGSGCGDGEIFCWKQCMDASQMDCDATSALCYDTGSNEVITFPDSRDDMCPSGMSNCVLMCPQEINGYDNGTVTDDSDPTSSSFCTGSGTTMFMDGFRIAFAGNSPCVNFFFIVSTMNTWWKLFFGWCGYFLLAFFVEFLSKMRRNCYTSWISDCAPERKKLLFVSLVSLHLIQVLCGYLIMLGAMTYSVEILFAVVLGLTAGYVVFNADAPPSKKAEPCCMNSDYTDMG